MALARARQAARRTKDRWKSKNWFKLTAPASFNNAVLAETLSDEPDKLANRTVEVTLNELTGDMKQMHIKLTFQVKEVVDTSARTAFVGHSMTSDYVRRLVRKGNSRIPAVFDVQTQDGTRIRVKPFAVTERRCQTTQSQEVRRAMGRALEESAARNNLSAFLADILLGDLTNRMFKEVRKVYPVRRVEIAKSEIIQGTALVDETPVLKPAPAEEAPVEVELQEGAEPRTETETKKVEDLTEEEGGAPAPADDEDAE
jgi:small subunit ribosomal protein S3Ae